MQALRIEVAGREILGRPEDMSQPWGLFVRKDGFQGWGGLPAGRREALARAVQHGEHDTPVYLPSRVVTVDGWAIAPTPDALQRKLLRIAGAAADGTKKTRFSVAQWGDVQFADGRRILGVTPDELRGGNARRHYGAFQLQFVFADPRKYGETNRSPEVGTATSIQVAHRGTFPAFSVVEIPDAPAVYTISSPGGVFTVSGATAGGTHRVDLRSGRVTRNGVEMPDVGHGDLWAVPDGPGWTYEVSVPAAALTPDTFV